MSLLFNLCSANHYFDMALDIMTPAEFYLSDAPSFDSIELASYALLPQVNHSTGKSLIRKALCFSAPANLDKFAVYRLLDSQLQIVSPFGAGWLSADSLLVDSTITLTCHSPDSLSSWPIHLGAGWCNWQGVAASPRSMSATKRSDGKFEPLHTISHARISGGRPFEWVVVFLSEPHSSIQKNQQGGADITTLSGVVFEISKGRAADLVLAGKAQWATPAHQGFFELGPLPPNAF